MSTDAQLTSTASPGSARATGGAAPPVVSGHMPALDGVRGLAVLLVLIFHFIGQTLPTNGFERLLVSVTNYGAYGVELFFVLSGFLITGILYDARDKPNYFTNFYMRRALRIFPLYYGVLILVFLIAPLIPLLRGPTLDSLVDRQAWAWLYAINLYIAKEGTWSFSYLQHFWSLAIEEHFYLFWPLVVFLLVHKPRMLIAACLAMAACAILGRIIGSVAGLSLVTTYVLTPLRLDGLALGAALAVIVRQPGGLDRLVGILPRVAAVFGALVALSFVWTRLASNPLLELVQPLRAGLVQVLLACLLVWALVAPARSVISRFFTSRPMTILGTYSYGLYVYHHFISYYLTTNRTEMDLARWLGSHTLAIVVQAALGMAASFAIAYVSYEYFEKRFLALKHRYENAGHPASPRPT